MDGLGVPGPLRRGVLAFHQAGGANLRRLAGRHGHLIPELLRGRQAYSAGQLIRDTEVRAVHEHREHWPGGWPPAGTAGGNMGAVSTGGGLTPAAGRPRHSHRPPARSGLSAAVGPTAPGRPCATLAAPSRGALGGGSLPRPPAPPPRPPRSPPPHPPPLPPSPPPAT